MTWLILAFWILSSLMIGWAMWAKPLKASPPDTREVRRRPF